MAATWRFSCLFFREQLVNDDIGDAKVITGPDFEDRLSTHRATLQSRERYSTCANTTSATVWYRYTPATAGVVTLDTLESDFDTVIAVWSGSEFDDFVRVTCSDDAPLLGAQSLTFSVLTGRRTSFRWAAGATLDRIRRRGPAISFSACGVSASKKLERRRAGIRAIPSNSYEKGIGGGISGEPWSSGRWFRSQSHSPRWLHTGRSIAIPLTRSWLGVTTAPASWATGMRRRARVPTRPLN